MSVEGYDEGTPLSDDMQIYETDDGIRFVQDDEGTYYIEAEDGNFYSQPDAAPDEAEDHDAYAHDAEATDDPPAWAQPLIDRYNADVELDIRSDERSRVEAEEADEEGPLVEFLRERPHLLEDWDNYLVAVEKADGDPVKGAEYYEAARADFDDTIARAERHEGVNQPKDLDSAISSWFEEKREDEYKADKLRPTGERDVVQIVEDDDGRAVEKVVGREKYGDPLAHAMDSFAADLHARNVENRKARAIVRGS